MDCLEKQFGFFKSCLFIKEAGICADSDLHGASSEEIMKVIDRCPSGALSYKMVKKAGESEMTSAQIKVMKNGPLLVEGNCALIDWTCKEAASNKHFALCMCSSSKNKPFAMERTSRSDSTIQNKRDKDPVPLFNRRL